MALPAPSVNVRALRFDRGLDDTRNGWISKVLRSGNEVRLLLTTLSSESSVRALRSGSEVRRF